MISPTSTFNWHLILLEYKGFVYYLQGNGSTDKESAVLRGNQQEEAGNVVIAVVRYLDEFMI